MRSARTLLVFALLALAGCRADVRVTLDAGAEGHGHVRVAVTLDKPAVAAIGDLRARLRTDDLAAAGWRVDIARPSADGSVTVAATHAFGDPSEVRLLLQDVGGPGGPLRDVRLAQRRSFFTTRTTLRGTVDLTAGLAAFTDAALTGALGGQPLGLTDEQLRKALGGPADRAFGLKVAARLPGAVESNAPAEAGGEAVWSPPLGATTVLRASSTAWNRRAVALTTIAVLAAVTLAILLAVRVAGRRRAERPAAQPPAP